MRPISSTVAVQAALGLRPGMEVFGTDYPMPDGSGVRDYIQVSDLARAHMDALRHLRRGGENLTAIAAMSGIRSEVVEVVKKVSGVDFPAKFDQIAGWGI